MTIMLPTENCATPTIVRDRATLHRYIRNRPGEWIDVTDNVPLRDYIPNEHGEPGRYQYNSRNFVQAFPDEDGFERCHAEVKPTGWRRIFRVHLPLRPLVRYNPDKDLNRRQRIQAQIDDLHNEQEPA